MGTGVQSAAYEMASVLFMDIVSYSLGSIDEQTELLTMLQEIVRGTEEFKAAFAKGELLSLPTGDGMALVFLRDPVSPAKCALEIAAALKDHAQIKLRMGLHIGPVRRHADIRENMNVVGGGINMAQRVMDCGDAGHILVSQQVAEVLQQLRGWSDSLQDLGTQEVKHGVKVHLYNLCKDGLGNLALPKKLQAGSQQPAQAQSAGTGRWKWAILAGFVVLAGAGAFALRGLKTPATPVTSSVSALPQRELQYYMTVQKYRNGKPYQSPFRVAGERVFEPDYRIWLHLSSPQPGYLYVLNEGPESTSEKPDLNTLFPSPLRADGSARLDPEKEINIPSGDGFVFDKQKGREKLWMVWSAAEIPDLDALKKWVNEKDKGTVGDRKQAQDVLAQLRKFAETTVEVTTDQTNLMTILKGKGSVIARRFLLDHD